MRTVFFPTGAVGARQGCVGFGYLVSPLGPPLLPPLATAARWRWRWRQRRRRQQQQPCTPSPPPRRQPLSLPFVFLPPPPRLASPRRRSSLCTPSFLAHSPFPPSLSPCRTPQRGASRFFNEGSAQYLGCHNLPPTSRGGPPATANPPSSSDLRLAPPRGPTNHDEPPPSTPAPSCLTPLLLRPLAPSPVLSFLFPVFNVSFDVSLRVNAEWARGWAGGDGPPGGKCISSLLCFTFFLSFSVRVSLPYRTLHHLRLP